MKYKIALTVFCWCAFSAGIAYPADRSLDLKAEAWARETLIFSGSNHRGNPFSKNAFSIERGYLTLEGAFVKNLTARLTLDFYSDFSTKGATNVNVNDKFWAAGTGIKLKFCYISWMSPWSWLGVTGGIQKVQFGLMPDWEYVSVEKDLIDRTKLLKSADAGLSLTGSLSAKKFEYGLQLLNGEGYESAGTKLNAFPGFCGTLRVTPVRVLMFGISGFNEISGKFGKEINRTVYAGFARMVTPVLKIWAEGAVKEEETSAQSGHFQTGRFLMLMSSCSLREWTGQDLEIFARIDYDDLNRRTSTEGSYFISAGLNWTVLRSEDKKPSFVLQADYQRTEFENRLLKAQNGVLIQARWIFASRLTGS